jgi:hypothetical protein
MGAMPTCRVAAVPCDGTARAVAAEVAPMIASLASAEASYATGGVFGPAGER